jgi:hypothetical protein
MDGKMQSITHVPISSGCIAEEEDSTTASFFDLGLPQLTNKFRTTSPDKDL